MSTILQTTDPAEDAGLDADDPDVTEGTVMTAPPPAYANPRLNGKIISVIAYKGGVGKSTLAYELAYMLNGVLVDFEYDRGAVTVTWGYRYQERLSVPILDALEKQRVPVPLKGVRKPDLVPGHPELATLSPPTDVVADALETWAREWNRPVVVDTHPGGSNMTQGAAAAASVIVSPVVLATKELEATAGMLDEMADYPIVLAPNKVPRIPNALMLTRLEDMAARPGIRVGPAVSEYVWLPRRTQRVAVTSYNPVPKRIAPFHAEVHALAKVVGDYATAA